MIGIMIMIMNKELLQRLYDRDGINEIILQPYRWAEKDLILFEDDKKIDLIIDNNIIIIVKLANERIGEYLGDIHEYASKFFVEIKTQKLRGYLIGCDMNPLLANYNFLQEDGYWFKTTPIIRGKKNVCLGELYLEIITDFKCKNVANGG